MKVHEDRLAVMFDLDDLSVVFRRLPDGSCYLRQCPFKGCPNTLFCDTSNGTYQCESCGVAGTFEELSQHLASEHTPTSQILADSIDPDEFVELGNNIGSLLQSKNKQYGSSFLHCADMLKLLYPVSVMPHQYGDALLIVRMWDKMQRIAQKGYDEEIECPYRDIAGYGILGQIMWEKLGRGKKDTAEEANGTVADCS